MTLEAARREIAAIWADEHPQENSGVSISAMPLRDAMVGGTRTPLLVLLASAALVLLDWLCEPRRSPAIPRPLPAQRVRRPRRARCWAPASRTATAHRERRARPGRGAAGLLVAQSMLSLLHGLARPRAAGLHPIVARFRAWCSSRRLLLCAPAWRLAWCRRFPPSGARTRRVRCATRRGCSERGARAACAACWWRRS